jgi:hypothetical protein
LPTGVFNTEEYGSVKELFQLLGSAHDDLFADLAA